MAQDLAEPLEAILIPEDSRDPITGVFLDPSDGGYGSLYGILAGEPEEIELTRSPGLAAFVDEAARRSDAPRNNRATQLLAADLPAGGWVAGPLVLAGQQEDGGLAALPDDVTIAKLREVC